MSAIRCSGLWLRLCLAPAVLFAVALPLRAEEEVRVSVVAILASEAKGAKTDPEVAAIAREVKKKYPAMTGFRLARMTCKSVSLDKEEKFDLVDNEVACVVVLQGADRNDRVRLKVKPPHVREITYSTCCAKYFPIVTRYQTKDKQEQLIIAVMVSTCQDR